MEYRGTTILAVRAKNKIAIGGDGQVTLADNIVKHKAKKIRTLYGGTVIVGFAGASADAFALLERFEKKLEEFQGNLVRSATELAKDWRMDRSLRRLESLLVAIDKKHLLLVSGSGDVIEPDDNVLGIGSGGSYAASAAKALLRHTKLPAKEIVTSSLKIAAEICVYTNDTITVEELA